MCEFFYSAIDEQIFKEENEFASILRESFPNLKSWNLTRVEWRTIRRLLGKPRRCSKVFFEEERMYLEEKRMKIRSVYEGSYLNVSGSVDVLGEPHSSSGSFHRSQGSSRQAASSDGRWKPCLCSNPISI